MTTIEQSLISVILAKYKNPIIQGHTTPFEIMKDKIALLVDIVKTEGERYLELDNYETSNVQVALLICKELLELDDNLTKYEEQLDEIAEDYYFLKEMGVFKNNG